MATFIFKAKNIEGKIIKGELSAESEQEVRIKLRAKYFVPLSVQAKSKPSKISLNLSKSPIGSQKVTRKELQIFTRQFAVLISSGVPVVQSLEAMAQGAKSPSLINVLNHIIKSIRSGKRLGESMAMHPDVFDRMYINLVGAGEDGGVLDDILGRLAEYMEKSGKLRNKIMSALTYPLVIILVAMTVISGILVFVIPSFQSMYSQKNQELPQLTKVVVALSESFQNYWFIFLGIPILLMILAFRFYKTSEGRKFFDTIFIEIPLLGIFIEKGAVARFSRTFATLLAAGIRINECLDISAATSGNWVVENALKNAKESINKGKSLAEPLTKEKHIPKMVSQMISIGEQTGNMDVMLNKIADFFEDEVDAAASALTSVIEPILMLVLGIVIAVLVLAMYLPIFNVGNIMGG